MDQGTTAEQQQQQARAESDRKKRMMVLAEEEAKVTTCQVQVAWLAALSAERDRMEDENMRLGDRLGALQVRLRAQEETNHKLRETNDALLQKLKQAGRSLRRESARLRKSIHMGEVTPAEAVVSSMCANVCACVFLFQRDKL